MLNCLVMAVIYGREFIPNISSFPKFSSILSSFRSSRCSIACMETYLDMSECLIVLGRSRTFFKNSTLLTASGAVSPPRERVQFSCCDKVWRPLCGSHICEFRVSDHEFRRYGSSHVITYMPSFDERRRILQVFRHSFRNFAGFRGF